MRHETDIKDTANRIRRTLRNRPGQGGVFQQPVFGNIKPPGAKSDAAVSKDPAAETSTNRTCNWNIMSSDFFASFGGGNPKFETARQQPVVAFSV